MIVIASMLAGAVTGAYTAKRKHGNLADILQYGGVFAILFGLLGLFLTVFIEKML